MSTAMATQARKPTTGYAPVNGLEMYYEMHGSGSGEPLVLLHGSFMTVSNNWAGWIGELSKTRTVIYLTITRADLLGYSMGGGVAMQVAIRHPDKVRKVVSVSALFRGDGLVKEALDAFPKLTADAFKGSPIETEYKKLSPTPNDFPPT